MNQIKFIIASILVELMTTSGIASSISAGFAVIYPGAAAATGTMTLEQLLVWIQQYNLAHPENPIVLDMNTILSVPPQQIKTIIETHINTVTHEDHDNNNDHNSHDHHDHNHHHFDWGSLFHHPDQQHQHERDPNLSKNPMNFPNTHDNNHDDNGKIDYSGGKDDLTHSDDDNPSIPAASSGESDSDNSDDGSSDDSSNGGSSSDSGSSSSDSGGSDSDGGSDSGGSDGGGGGS